MAKPMTRGAPQSAPSKPFYRAPLSFMVQRFTKRPQPNVAGALQYSYDTFGAQQLSVVGAGTGLARQGLDIGQRPMVSLPTVHISGIDYNAGQLTFTPLSENPNG